MENGLSTRTMLVSLSISMWRSRKRDKRATRETAARYGTIEKAGNYNKNLMPIQEGNAYWQLERAASTAYDHFREQTLPWLDDGTRIATSANYMHLMEIMNQDRAVFTGAVADFKRELPQLIKRAETVLGPKLFHVEEYPQPHQIDGKFGFRIKVFPLPSAEDFRAGLGNTTVEAIREQIVSDVHEAFKDAVRDLYRRLYEQVSNIHGALTLGGVIKRATIENLREVCEVLPRLNPTNDQGLVDMQRRIEEQLTCHDAEDLSKKNKKFRKQVAETAARIQSDLAAFMGKGL